MGTSTSTKGPKGTNPLLPPWAEESEDLELRGSTGQTEVINNDDVQKVLTKPSSISIDKNRFLAVRRNFTKYLQSGERKALNASLANYSRSSGGGKGVAKKLASGVKAGTGLMVILSGGSVSNPSDSRSLSYKDLQGLTVDQAIDKLAEFLSPKDADSEYVRNALDEALSQTLEGEDVFNQIVFDNELLESIMNSYLSTLILNDVVNTVGDSWKNCGSPVIYAQRQNELDELISDIVNNKVYELFKQKGNINSMTAIEIITLQQELICESVQSWEKYFEGEE